MRSVGWVLVLVLVVVACGPSTKPASGPEPGASAAPAASSAPAPEVKAPEPAPEPFPTKCASSDGGVCAVGDAFADRICKVQLADVGLALFAKGSPWTRGYLTRNTEAWNASGGGSARNKMLFDEEVVILRKRAASAMMVGQGGSYDAVRWDGSCVTLAEEEVTLKKPPKAKASPITWKYLDAPTRDALSADAKIGAAYEKRRKECKGATSGDVSLACVKADAALSDVVIDHVRGGGAVPTPKLP